MLLYIILIILALIVALIVFKIVKSIIKAVFVGFALLLMVSLVLAGVVVFDYVKFSQGEKYILLTEDDQTISGFKIDGIKFSGDEEIKDIIKVPENASVIYIDHDYYYNNLPNNIKVTRLVEISKEDLIAGIEDNQLYFYTGLVAILKKNGLKFYRDGIKEDLIKIKPKLLSYVIIKNT